MTNLEEIKFKLKYAVSKTNEKRCIFGDKYCYYVIMKKQPKCDFNKNQRYCHRFLSWYGCNFQLLFNKRFKW